MHQVHCEYIRHREWLLWQPTEKGLLAQPNSKMAASCKVSLICHPQEKSYVWLIFLWQVAAILSKVSKGDVGLTRLCNGVVIRSVHSWKIMWISLAMLTKHFTVERAPISSSMPNHPRHGCATRAIHSTEDECRSWARHNLIWDKLKISVPCAGVLQCGAGKEIGMSQSHLVC